MLKHLNGAILWGKNEEFRKLSSVNLDNTYAVFKPKSFTRLGGYKNDLDLR